MGNDGDWTSRYGVADHVKPHEFEHRRSPWLRPLADTLSGFVRLEASLLERGEPAAQVLDVVSRNRHASDLVDHWEKVIQRSDRPQFGSIGASQQTPGTGQDHRRFYFFKSDLLFVKFFGQSPIHPARSSWRFSQPEIEPQDSGHIFL